MRRRRAPLLLACIGLVAGILACNAPTTTPEAPRSDVTLPTESPASPDETAVPSATQISPAATPTATAPPPTVPTPTETPVPTPYPTPSAGRPTPAPPVSTGPLDFEEPARLDDYRPLDNGGFEATIILRITGGAVPYIVHHDMETFTTEELNPAIVFEAQGCSALVHTIIVESADGQRVQHDYWIPAPWCD